MYWVILHTIFFIYQNELFQKNLKGISSSECQTSIDPHQSRPLA